mgnify:CR=1 FL=1
MANIFSRNYKFDEPKVTSTQDKGYFTTEVASTVKMVRLFLLLVMFLFGSPR